MDSCDNNLRDTNDVLKRELSSFIDLLRERLGDIAYDRTYTLYIRELSKLEDRLTAHGISENRPEEPIIGTSYFDTSLNKPIFFNGLFWVDANGDLIEELSDGL